MDEDSSEGPKSSKSSSFWLPKKPVLKLSEIEQSLAPVDWGTDRPRPVLTQGLWKGDEAEELEKYIDWHRNHPHCITPRKVVDDMDGKLVGRQKFDENNPGKFYTGNGIKVAPIPKNYLPTQFGIEGDIDEVSVTAWRNEYGTLVQKGAEDPWFLMSVKDELEQSHMDGSHTTVKFKSPSNRAEREQQRLQKQKSWARPKFEDYEGGLHPHTGQHAKALEKLAQMDKAVLHDVKRNTRIGPWAETYVYSKFTAGGTALQGFTQKDLEDKVQKAVSLHIEEVKNNVLGSSSTKKAISQKKSSKKSKKQAILKADPYEAMKEKLGGSNKLEKMEKGWMKLVKNIRKHSNKQKNQLDTKIDLVDACEKLRVLKVAGILLAREGHVDMKSPEDEPLFLHTIMRAIKMDGMTNSLRPEDEVNDTADRKKLQKILNILIKYGADVNMMTGKDQIGAIHMTAGSDNSKLLRWLISQKANVNLLTKSSDHYSALMIGAKYCYVHVMAELVNANCDLNLTNKEGHTALHIAAMFGQSRSALFLLRVGIDKKLQDMKQRTAARVAEERTFQGTAQAIASFTPAMREYKVQLQYMLDEHERGLTKQKSIDHHMNTFLDNMFDGAMELFNKGTSLFKPITDFIKKRILRKFMRIRIFPMIMMSDFDEAENDNDDDDDDSEAGDHHGAVMDGTIEDLDAQLLALEAHHHGGGSVATVGMDDVDGFGGLDGMEEEDGA